jgi:predicted Zn finger-like uncharacterized protein
MRAICPTCDTAYTIPDDRIGAAGRKVRCTKCGGSWKVMLPAEDADAPEAEPEPEKPDFDEAPRRAAPAQPAPVEDDPFAAATWEAEPPAPPPAAPAPEPEPEPAKIAEDAPRTAPVVKPTLAPDVKIRFKKRSLRTRFNLPKMPVALTRATPFFGPLVFATAILFISGLLIFRNAVVATAPGLAGFYAALGLEVNLRGLSFGPIQTLREIDNGQPVLVVEGTLSNTTQKPRDVPALRFALRDGDAQELYAWSIDPKATTIAAGDSVKFRTRLVAPPDRASDLQVRFVERRNQQARLP